MKDIIEVYHAGTEIIDHPLCSVGRPNLDFGKGFYLTDIYDQALVWARRKGRERITDPKINIYKLEKKAILTEARCLIFKEYNEKWLDFIVSCRLNKDFCHDFDYIEGGVADDRVIDTINLYIQGFIDKERALSELIYLTPNNQICIASQSLLDNYLKFSYCVTVPKDEIL